MGDNLRTKESPLYHECTCNERQRCGMPKKKMEEGSTIGADDQEDQGQDDAGMASSGSGE